MYLFSTLGGKSFLDAVESASNSPFTTTFTSLDMSEVRIGKISWICYILIIVFLCVCVCVNFSYFSG